jgi:hypothetical protein
MVRQSDRQGMQDMTRAAASLGATVDAAWGEESLFNWQNQASGRGPLGECRFNQSMPEALAA